MLAKTHSLKRIAAIVGTWETFPEPRTRWRWRWWYLSCQWVGPRQLRSLAFTQKHRGLADAQDMSWSRNPSLTMGTQNVFPSAEHWTRENNLPQPQGKTIRINGERCFLLKFIWVSSHLGLGFKFKLTRVSLTPRNTTRCLAEAKTRHLMGDIPSSQGT